MTPRTACVRGILAIRPILSELPGLRYGIAAGGAKADHRHRREGDSTMLHDVIFVLLTALLSSIVTWGLAYVLYRQRLEAELDRRLAQIQAEFEERVKSGVRAAALELLPDLREQVKLGFIDAMTQSRAAGLVEDTAKVFSAGAGLGAGLFETGVNALLGLTKSPKR
jgi:hypothetical protein